MFEIEDRGVWYGQTDRDITDWDQSCIHGVTPRDAFEEAAFYALLGTNDCGVSTSHDGIMDEIELGVMWESTNATTWWKYVDNWRHT